MTNAISYSDAAAAPASTTGTTTKSDSLASKDAFLQLLVAQIKNQDPMSPSDGTQFVAQLAQFSNLEQSVSMRESLDAIQKTLDTRLPAVAATK